MSIENRVRMLESRMAQVELLLKELQDRQEKYPVNLTNITLPKATNLDFPASGASL
jgi:hypothetical protein